MPLLYSAPSWHTGRQQTSYRGVAETVGLFLSISRSVSSPGEASDGPHAAIARAKPPAIVANTVRRARSLPRCSCAVALVSAVFTVKPPQWHEHRSKRPKSTISRLRVPVAHQFWPRLHEKHPMLDGKSVEIVVVTNAGVSAALPLSPTAQNLQGLGFRQLNKSAITATADGAPPGTRSHSPQLHRHRREDRRPHHRRPSKNQTRASTTRISCPRAAAMSAL